ncbi:MAG: electron transfer flavoprotein subunit alpha/FixB family protein [Deltaproteobacteria bacterium]|nr:electron transfer flavoprotein subunit alpha/FixB family protein [Deltaproteobacteria bacterium]MBW2302359.1 electron transfer flavoprotein subunit alpha/FixB family protein [Deltaproteobacteria bacterium]
MEEILVLAEHRQGQVRDITFEILTLANRLGIEREATVSVLLSCGGEAYPGEKELAASCDDLLVIGDEGLAHYNADHYLAVLERVLAERRPRFILMGHTSMGMDLAPSLAARLSIPLVTDCLEVEATSGGLQILRQMYGGKIQARISLKPSEQYLLTIRPGCFECRRGQGKSAHLKVLDSHDWTGLRGRRFLEYLETGPADVDIAEADILVSVGRGIGKPENIPLAQEFADAIGATLSCSRPVADEGWLPKSRQVGTSGKTVRPKVYIALGISGAYQHQAGMKNSGTIIAVNKDPQAPIFGFAHYGIIGDVMKVLPILKEKFA